MGQARDEPLRGSVAKALLNKATLNVPALLSKGPLRIDDDLLVRFGRSSESLLARELVAAILIQKGATLGLLGHNEEAIAVYDLVLALFGSDPATSSLRLVWPMHSLTRATCSQILPGQGGRSNRRIRRCVGEIRLLWARCRSRGACRQCTMEKGRRSVCLATMRK